MPFKAINVNIKKYIKHKQAVCEKAAEIVSDLTGQNINENINYYLTNMLHSSINAEYDSTNNIIILNKSLLNNKDIDNKPIDINYKLLLILTHENTHAIQSQKKLLINPFYSLFFRNDFQIAYTGILEAPAYFNSAFTEVFRFDKSDFDKKYTAYEYRAAMVLKFDEELLINNKNFKLDLPKSIINSLIELYKNDIGAYMPIQKKYKEISKFKAKNIGLSIALVSFIANDFSILKTEQFLLREPNQILEDLIKIKDSEFKKISSILNEFSSINQKIIKNENQTTDKNSILKLFLDQQNRKLS